MPVEERNSTEVRTTVSTQESLEFFVNSSSFNSTAAEEAVRAQVCSNTIQCSVSVIISTIGRRQLTAVLNGTKYDVVVNRSYSYILVNDSGGSNTPTLPPVSCNLAVAVEAATEVNTDCDNYILEGLEATVELVIQGKTELSGVDEAILSESLRTEVSTGLNVTKDSLTVKQVQFAPPPPPPSSPPPATPPVAASASGDLHVHHAGGGSFDFRGPLDGAVCNLFQARGASLNAEFTFANFTLAPEDPRALRVLEVHGSFLTAAFIKFATVLEGEIAYVLVTFSAGDIKRAHVMVKMGQHTLLDTQVGSTSERLAFGDVSVGMGFVFPASTKLTLSNSYWSFTLTPGTYRNSINGARRTRIDVAVTALQDPLAERVAPHGLIGQGFDGLYMEGKKDNYVPDEDGIFATYAQGEGAVEGTASDYLIDAKDPFSTVFKFGRFDAIAAPPRDSEGIGKMSA